MFSHPAVEYVCRHCGCDADYEPEVCFDCGPVCASCFTLACEREDGLERSTLGKKSGVLGGSNYINKGVQHGNFE